MHLGWLLEKATAKNNILGGSYVFPSLLIAKPLLFSLKLAELNSMCCR